MEVVGETVSIKDCEMDFGGVLEEVAEGVSSSDSDKEMFLEEESVRVFVGGIVRVAVMMSDIEREGDSSEVEREGEAVLRLLLSECDGVIDLDLDLEREGDDERVRERVSDSEMVEERDLVLVKVSDDEVVIVEVAVRDFVVVNVRDEDSDNEIVDEIVLVKVSDVEIVFESEKD